jgi:septal ring factor EnvC (AmiA/AmiB activator)
LGEVQIERDAHRETSERLEKEIGDMLKQPEESKNTSSGEFKKLERDRDTYKKQLASNQSQLEKTKEELAAVKKKLAKTEQELKVTRQELETSKANLRAK